MFIPSHTTTPAPFPLLILCYGTNPPTRRVRYYGAHVLSSQPFVSSPPETVADMQGQQGECAWAAHCYSATFTANVSVFAELFQDTDIRHSCQSFLLKFVIEISKSFMRVCSSTFCVSLQAPRSDVWECVQTEDGYFEHLRSWIYCFS